MTKTTNTKTADQSKTLAARKRAKAKANQLMIDSIKPMKRKLTKSQLMQELADRAQAPKQGVIAVMKALEDLIKASIHPKGIGEFAIPGLVKITTRKVKASKGGKTVMSFGKETVTKPKPAHIKTKARVLTGLKAVTQI